MICNVCGGSESYVQDGVEYCRECSEQIKGSIDEDAGEEGCIKKSLLSSPVAKKDKKDKTKVLAPWLYFEAFNLILFKQVSALIKLGCSEKLKTVVLSIWARYLQKCESAFITTYKKDNFIPRLSVFASKRDIELLYGEGLSTNLKNIKRPFFKSKRRKKKVVQKSPKSEIVEEVDEANCSANESLTASSENGANMSFINQNSEFPPDFSSSEVSGNESSESFMCNSENVKAEVSGNESSESSVCNSRKVKAKKRPVILYSFPARKLKKKGFRRTDSSAQETCVSHMTLKKTLSFCHLGLLYTEDQMLLSDLIRLVNDGAVPYIDVPRHFPTSMQLQSSDYRYFITNSSPDAGNVSFTSAQLIDFLQLPKFKQPPLLPIAIRFVKDLNLPCDLIPVLKHLISKVNEDSGELRKRKKIPERKPGICPLYEAQAMSVVAVALKMLFVLDGKFEMEHSEIMTKLNSISEGQTFFVWKDWEQQMALKEYLFLKKYTMNNNTMNRLDSLCADRINGGYPISSIHLELNTLVEQLIRNQNTTRNELKTLFKSMVDDTSFRRNPTSFPLRYELHRLMNEWKRLPLFKDTENIDFSFISKDFSLHKLYYRPSATTDEPMSLLLFSLYESLKLIHTTDCDEFYENIIRTSKKYWYVNHLTSTPDFSKGKWVNDFPSSFKWLFNFMCKYLQVDKFDFYKEFRYIESKLLMH